MKTTFHDIKRAGRAGLILVPLMGVAVIFALYFFKPGGGTSYTETVISAKDKAKITVQQVNLHSISKSLTVYGMRNAGRMPASTDELSSKCGVPRDKFADASPTGEGLIYIPGQSQRSPASNILLYPSAPDSKGLYPVLYLGGKIESLSEQQLNEAVDKTSQSMQQ